MNNLIAELERATEGSRELDAKIFRAMDFCPAHHNPWPFTPDSHWGRTIPEFTTSLDAALTLSLEGWGWLVRGGDGEVFANLTRGGTPVMVEGHQANSDWQDNPTYAPTPALALCIASLRARQAMEEAA